MGKHHNQTIRRLINFFCVVCAISEVFGASNLAAYEERLEKGDLSALKELAQLPPDISIPALRKHAFWQSIVAEDANRIAIRREAAQLLAQIPGHALYSIKKIKETKEFPLHIARVKRQKEFRTLSLLKSDETINVLGEYLKDSHIPPRHPDTPLTEWNPEVPNSMLAGQALAALNLPDAPKIPAEVDAFSQKHVEIWSEWWVNRQQNTANEPLNEVRPPADKVEPEQPAVARQETTTQHKNGRSAFFENGIAWAALLLGLIAAIWLLFRVINKDK